MKDIFVTKSFLPPIKKYERYLQLIWKNNKLTNQGPLVKELELKLSKYLGVKYIHFVTNGTLALQIALNSLDITNGEIITTPFSYVATTSSILWERCKPVFVDINSDTLCIDFLKIEEAITPKTKAILAVHVFGYPCNVEKIKSIAKKHKIKVIYDAAHAFGCTYKKRSLLNFGDISICSFHATKIFHTIEGGCLATNNKKISEKIELIKRFGHVGDTHYRLGINAKASEFQAAMGLCNIEFVDKIIQDRKEIVELYNKLLKDSIHKIKLWKNIKHNYAYYPVVLKSEAQTLKTIEVLNNYKIYPRRYFYPSLNTLTYLNGHFCCPISEDISTRVLCLPLYFGLSQPVVKKICKIINNITND